MPFNVDVFNVSGRLSSLRKSDPFTIGLEIIELYFYRATLVAKDKNLRFYSCRNTKITTVNPSYLALNEFKVHVISRGFASLYAATDETATGTSKLVTTVGKIKCKLLFWKKLRNL